jgi:DNA-binding NtrC family response regulator
MIVNDDSGKAALEGATEALKTEDTPVRVRKMSLVITQGPDAGRRVGVSKTSFSVGKDTACDLCLPDPTVSRNHLEIECRGDSYTIRDLESTNGTKVDGIQIKEAYLVPGSRIAAGNVELIFQPFYEKPGPELVECERFGSLVAASPAMKTILGLLRKAARSTSTVLMHGETGVGKSALAQAFHSEGPRSMGPFVVFDCGSVAPTLIESELFGAKKGAFTGAVSSRPGACEQAQNGTLFLDEIEELPLELQTKLLRVIEEREVRRLGSTKSVSLNIQIIAASKIDLGQAARSGSFRLDLYYRIAVIDIQVPPLSERVEDIPLLCRHFLGERGGDDAWARLEPSLREQLTNYSWPGNLRELRNVLERLQCIGPDGMPVVSEVIDETDGELPLALDMNRPFKEVKEELIDSFELQYLERLLSRSDGRVAPAARAAGLNRKYFYDLLKKHGLRGRNQ